MSKHPDQPAWRALTVKPRHEKFVSQNLRNRGLEEFLPLHASKRSWSDRSAIVDLPLFPGYIFCQLSAAHRLLALSTPGVTSIIGFGGEDASIEAEEIDQVRTILSSGLPVEPWAYVKAGHRVEIHNGPLAGLQGTVVRERGLWRLVVNVELLQRSVAAEIGRESVHPAALPQAAVTRQALLA